jgi:UDP-N-acetylmuramoylalanine--D-glutamate ligase
MRAADLGRRRVAIWGLAREGRAAIRLLRQAHPGLPLVLIDDDAAARPPPGLANIACAFGAGIAAALERVEIIVKSPGISLYRDEIEQARKKGRTITSLINLWFAERLPVTTICITGTKGKSTTASLLAHLLTGLGHSTALAGNIGLPVTEIGAATRYAVIEVSSYQAADFAGVCDIAVLTSLYPEHLDWHRSVENYYRDKANLLRRARRRIVAAGAAAAIDPFLGDRRSDLILFGDRDGVHPDDAEIFDAALPLGKVDDPYLARPHNLSDLCAALSVAKALGIAPAAALAAARGFTGLAHRQQELGSKNDVLFVDDSISTIPESTLAALDVYAGRDITLILGGYDRGIDYDRLVAALAQGRARRALCLGESGARIRAALAAGSGSCTASLARSMAEAVATALRTTPPGGVVLLSPAAPSYGQYRDFRERGHDFARQAGFAPDAGGKGG